MKFDFSISRRNRVTGNTEIFTVKDSASFDEAIKTVEKGVYDRTLQEEKESAQKDGTQGPQKT